MTIMRVGFEWTGFTGAPGYTNLFFTAQTPGTGQTDAVDRVAAFMTGISDVLPTDVTLTMQPEVVMIDEETGLMEGFGTPIEEPHTVSGKETGSYSSPAGALIHWNTNGVRNGRRVRGRTFLVPLAGARYDGDGTLSSSALTALRGAADNIMGAGFDSGFGVWSRPANGAGGAFFESVSYTVPDKSVVLRSRRD